MSILGKLFGKPNAPKKAESPYTHLAFVLLSDARLPMAEEIARSFSVFAPPGEAILAKIDGTEKSKHGQILSLRLNAKETSFVALMPVPVPKGEADEGAQFSVSSFGTGWKIPPHNAHLLVTMLGDADSSRVTQLSRFTSLLAAVVKCSPAVGVYSGAAGATHDSQFFLSVSADLGVVPRIVLWSGVSIAHEKDGRLSLLSLGMQQLDLPDLLLIAGESSKGTDVQTLYDFLAYVAERGEALPEGDTVGRSADERLPVQYVQSPIDSSKKVWRVELP